MVSKLRLAGMLACAALLPLNPSRAQAPSPPSPKAGAGDFLTLQQLRAKYAEPGAKFMTIKGIEVYYKDEGSGPALLLIHGSSSTLKTYDRIAELLKGRYRVIRYDIPPWGLSGPVPDSAVAAGLKAEDLPEALLTNLGVRSATVVGVSSGGTTGYFLAAKRPDMVERLIISNAPGDPVDYGPLKLSRRLAEEQAIGGRQSDIGFKRRSFWDAFFDFFAGEPERISPALRDQYYDFNRRVVEKNRFAGFALTENQALTAATAAKVVCPVLLVWGDRDPLLTPKSADVLAGYFKHADVFKLMLPDVGHYPPLEVPDRYARIIDDYVEAVTPVKPRAPPPRDR